MKKQILIVDDEKKRYRLIEAYLQNDGLKYINIIQERKRWTVFGRPDWT